MQWHIFQSMVVPEVPTEADVYELLRRLECKAEFHHNEIYHDGFDQISMGVMLLRWTWVDYPPIRHFQTYPTTPVRVTWANDTGEPN